MDALRKQTYVSVRLDALDVADAKAGTVAASRLEASGRKARLAVTLGDVRGIGPEIIEKAAASREVREAADLVFVGPSGAGIESTNPRAPGRRECGRMPVALPAARSNARLRWRSRATSTESSRRPSTRPRCSPVDTASRAHRDARDAHRTTSRHDAGRDEPVRRRIRCASCWRRRTSRCATCRAR